MKIKALIALATLALLAAGAAPAAAADTPPGFQLALNFTPSFPLKGFYDGLNANPLGGGADMLWRLTGTPVSVGLSLAIQGYGWTTRMANLSPDIPEIAVKVGTGNNMLLGHLLIRLQPAEGKIRPYVDGLVGMTYLWTETGIYSRDMSRVTSSVNFDDSALSFGVGGGVMLPLIRKPTFGLLFDAGARVIFGGQANYLPKGGLVRENGDVVANYVTSRTDLVTAHVGIALELHGRRKAAKAEAR